jgi:hypothetical protein
MRCTRTWRGVEAERTVVRGVLTADLGSVL